MGPYQISVILTATAILVFFLLFESSSVKERKWRAAGISLAIIAIVVVLLVCSVSWWRPLEPFLITAMVVAWFFAALYFLPWNKPTALVIGPVNERVDERDTMFAREEYQPGTEKYEKYYAVNRQHREEDDSLRRLPKLLEPGGRYYNPGQAQQIKAIFKVISELALQVDGDVCAERTEKNPSELTADIRDLTLKLGADDVGVARLDKAFVYSHVGRGPEQWGMPIELSHRFAIAFTIEMKYEPVQKAPEIAITRESALQYLRAALISVNMARYIRNLGYSARAHISDSNYQIMLPPVAHDAGLGELSRMGYLISPRYGARIRLGAVTTDLPLVEDRRVAFGVQDFCDICLKCATNCPSRAIPRGGKATIRGVEKWQISAEKCLRYWRIAGSDCGICMKVCPFSHPPTFVHDIVRRGIRNSSFARKISLLGDHLFYGRTVRPGNRGFTQ
jgi:ferredoxin